MTKERNQLLDDRVDRFSIVSEILRCQSLPPSTVLGVVDFVGNTPEDVAQMEKSMIEWTNMLFINDEEKRLTRQAESSPATAVFLIIGSNDSPLDNVIEEIEPLDVEDSSDV